MSPSYLGATPLVCDSVCFEHRILYEIVGPLGSPGKAVSTNLKEIHYNSDVMNFLQPDMEDHIYNSNFLKIFCIYSIVFRILQTVDCSWVTVVDRRLCPSPFSHSFHPTKSMVLVKRYNQHYQLRRNCKKNAFI